MPVFRTRRSGPISSPTSRTRSANKGPTALMRFATTASLIGVPAIALAMFVGFGRADEESANDERGLSKNDRHINATARRLIDEGRQIFRFETFGSEAFFGDALQLHKAIENVSPKTALAVGLKVDAEALPDALKAKI